MNPDASSRDTRRPGHRGVLRWAACLLVCLCLGGWWWLAGAGAEAGEPEAAPRELRKQWFFLIDASGSMNTAVASPVVAAGATRWSAVVSGATDFMRTVIAPGDEVRLCVFTDRAEQTLQSPWDAGSLGEIEAWLEARSRERKADGRTALWNALGLAMQHVDASGGDFLESWICLYSDGQDQASSAVRGNPWTFADGDQGKEAVKSAWLRMIARRTNTFLYQHLFGDWTPEQAPLLPKEVAGGVPNVSIERPWGQRAAKSGTSGSGAADARERVLVTIRPAETEQPSLVSDVAVKMLVRVDASPAAREAMRQDQLQVKVSYLEGAQGERAHAGVSIAAGGAIPLASGVHTLLLKPSTPGAFSGERVSGRLRLAFPDGSRRGLEFVGRREVALNFSAPDLLLVTSPEGAGHGKVVRVVRGQLVVFDVTNGGQEPASWTFGSTSDPRQGNRVEHRFAVARRETVSVRAGDRPPTVFTVDVVDVALAVAPVASEPLVAGEPCSLRVTWGAAPDDLKIARYEWRVGTLVRNTSPDVMELVEQFDAPASIRVRVVAYTDLGNIESDELTLTVKPGLTIAVRDPGSIDPRGTHEFTAVVEGLEGRPARVDWAFENPLTAEPVVPSLTRDVVDGACKVKVEMPADLPQGCNLRVRATLRVIGGPAGARSPISDWRDVPCNTGLLSVVAFEPPDGAQLHLGTALPMAVKVGGPGAAKASVQWKVTWPGAAAPVEWPREQEAAEGNLLASRMALMAGGRVRAGDRVGVVALVDGRPLRSWDLVVALPAIQFRIKTEGLADDKVIEFPQTFRARIEPDDTGIDRVRWQVRRAAADPVQEGTGLSIDVAPPAVWGKVAYVLTALVTQAEGALAQRVDLEFWQQATLSLKPSAGRIRLRETCNVALEGRPEALAEVQSVEWRAEPSGALRPSERAATLEGVRPGLLRVEADVAFRGGRGRLSLPATVVEVWSSATVRASPTLTVRDASTVDLAANPDPASDFESLHVDVLVDGKPLGARVDLGRSGVGSYVFPDGVFGEFTFRFVAKAQQRDATALGEQAIADLRHLRRELWFGWIAIVFLVMGAAVAGGLILMRGWVLGQHPRDTVLGVSTQPPSLAPGRGAATPLPGGPRARVQVREHWPRLNMRASVRLEAATLAGYLRPPPQAFVKGPASAASVTLSASGLASAGPADASRFVRANVAQSMQAHYVVAHDSEDRLYVWVEEEAPRRPALTVVKALLVLAGMGASITALAFWLAGY